MQAGDFQRYVWVQGDRKRQGNREKYQATSKRYLDTDVNEVDTPKKQKVVWPGEFENQFIKRNRNLEKIEQRRDGIESPAMHTPSDTQSIISKEDSIAGRDSEEVLENPSKTLLPVQPADLTSVSISDKYLFDEYLAPPKKLSSAHGGSFFLVSSSLINE